MSVILIILDNFLQPCRFFQPSGWTVPLRLSWRPIELTYCQPDPSRWIVRYLLIRNCNYAFLPRFTPQHLLTLANLGLPADKKLEECATFPSDRYFFFLLRRMEMSSWVPDIFYSLSITYRAHFASQASYIITHLHCILKVVLRIRIQDPVPFWPLDLGWVKNQDPEPGWTTRIIFTRA